MAMHPMQKRKALSYQNSPNSSSCPARVIILSLSHLYNKRSLAEITGDNSSIHTLSNYHKVLHSQHPSLSRELHVK
ncbi:hypothetical protein VNO80_10949 [Phaseolus coccineus]|uniref:Uncharacterized protein n=1 Tax=Phaseolus coccineus TaxID=3886 RepID=A0AAN9RDW5_PHACN